MGTTAPFPERRMYNILNTGMDLVVHLDYILPSYGNCFLDIMKFGSKFSWRQERETDYLVARCKTKINAIALAMQRSSPAKLSLHTICISRPFLNPSMKQLPPMRC